MFVCCDGLKNHHLWFFPVKWMELLSLPFESWSTKCWLSIRLPALFLLPWKHHFLKSYSWYPPLPGVASTTTTNQPSTNNALMTWLAPHLQAELLCMRWGAPSPWKSSVPLPAEGTNASKGRVTELKSGSWSTRVMERCKEVQFNSLTVHLLKRHLMKVWSKIIWQLHT